MIKSLTIKNWKAFEEKCITFDKGITFFVGRNGIGKTTVLEGICLSVTGRSVTADFHELVRDPNLSAEVKLDIEIEGKRVSIRRKFNRDRKLLAEMICDNNKQRMTWDELTSETLKFFSVDEMFFSRLTYMSEGEVYNYLKDPPSEALNSRIQEIFGIRGLQTLENYIRIIRKDRSSSIREISSELKTISKKKPADESQIEILDRKIMGLKEKEKSLQEKKDILFETIREIEEKYINYEKLKELCGEIVQSLKLKITITTEVFDKGLRDFIKRLEAKIISNEEDLKQTQALVGSVQSRLAYLNDIKQLLQSVVAETAKKEEVPCPICKRLIDKPLASSLIAETEKQIEGTEKELFNAQNTSSDLQTKISGFRKTIQMGRDYETKINALPSSILKKAKPLTFDKIDKLLSSLNESLNSKIREQEKNNSELEALKKEIYKETQELASMRAVVMQSNRLNLLKERLRIAYEGQMLAEILHEAIKFTIQRQKDYGLEPIFIQISHLWDKFRPESKWKIALDKEGIIRIQSKERQYGFSNLSGGEKTVLLVLTRVMLCRKLAPKIDFILIDEPLEHLDIRNRRSLLNFLFRVNKAKIIPQIIVTTFEETLIRKYYTEEKTRIELLN